MDFLGATCTATAGPAGDPLTIEKIKEAYEALARIECPINALAKRQGFDLDQGDTMIVPRAWAAAYGFPSRQGVVFSTHLDCSILLMRGSFRGPETAKFQPIL